MFVNSMDSHSHNNINNNKITVACMKEETKRIKRKEEKIEEEKDGERED